MVKRYELSSALSKSLFRNPTPKYRAVPFWAWNCFLEKDVLMHQIEVFKKTKVDGKYHVPIKIHFTAVGIIDIPTEKEILATMAEIRSNSKKARTA